MQGKLRSKSKAAREVELLARLATYEAALREIACYDDKGANERLKATGSYSYFDEPGSVMIARKALDTP